MPDAAAQPPKPVLRRRLAGAADTVFFGCQSVLYGCVGSLVLAGLAAGIVGALFRVAAPPPALWAATAVLFALITGYRLRRTVLARVQVGADGISVLGRFVPYSAIESTVRSWGGPSGLEGGEHMVLTLHGGEEVDFRIDTLPRRRREALVKRLQDEIAAYQQAARQKVLDALDRGERPIAAWREQLRRLSTGSEGYRAASVALADVQEALDNAAAPVERRIGAALALAGGGDPEARARIRVAAEASAEPKLRIALESIAAGEEDDAAVEEALVAAK
jgi:hypothetical protein